MDDYYEKKKRQGFFFTLHDINPSKPYLAMDPSVSIPMPVKMPGVISYWSRLSGRYRDSVEQKEYIISGCIDKKLPQRRIEDED